MGRIRADKSAEFGVVEFEVDVFEGGFGGVLGEDDVGVPGEGGFLDVDGEVFGGGGDAFVEWGFIRSEAEK